MQFLRLAYMLHNILTPRPYIFAVRQRDVHL